MPRKPLTDADLADLRARLKSDIPLVSLAAPDALRVLDEVTRARMLLRRIEWEGTVPDPTIPYEYTAGCPGCGAQKPSGTHRGHKPDCELAALIGK